MCSGSEVVGAATIPPVGAYVSALRTTSERVTASSQRPPCVHLPIHSSQKSQVSASACSGSTGAAARWCDGNHVRTKGIRSPAETVKSATVCRFSPCVSTGVSSATASGPAIATSRPSSSRRTHGTIEP